MKGIEFLDKMELWILPAWRRQTVRPNCAMAPGGPGSSWPSHADGLSRPDQIR